VLPSIEDSRVLISSSLSSIFVLDHPATIHLGPQLWTRDSGFAIPPSARAVPVRSPIVDIQPHPNLDRQQQQQVRSEI